MYLVREDGLTSTGLCVYVLLFVFDGVSWIELCGACLVGCARTVQRLRGRIHFVLLGSWSLVRSLSGTLCKYMGLIWFGNVLSSGHKQQSNLYSSFCITQQASTRLVRSILYFLLHSSLTHFWGEEQCAKEQEKTKKGVGGNSAIKRTWTGEVIRLLRPFTWDQDSARILQFTIEL